MRAPLPPGPRYASSRQPCFERGRGADADHGRARREQRHLTQAALARATGLRANTISELEAGRSYPDWSTIARIAWALEADLRQAADATLAEAGLEYQPTNDQLVVQEILDQLQSSQVTGLLVTLGASMLILALAFWFRDRAPLLGVAAILSVGVTTVWALGLMAALGIPFNVMTAMVSSLAVGIGVPFGIHVVNRFIEDRANQPDTMSAMRHTLAHTGGALVGSAVTTVAGFGVLMFSSVPPMQQFGIVVAMTIALALVTCLTLLPAMLTLWARWRGGLLRQWRRVPAIDHTRGSAVEAT